jgi:F-type H+-transporting ATPase subunit gamma
MATLKQIRRRIRSVKNTQQITKAMEMVAAAKLRRSQDRVTAARPYAAAIGAMLENLAAAAGDLSHPLFEVRPVRRRALVVIASDKGLCGSFNMNVIRTAERMVHEGDRGGGHGERTAAPAEPPAWDLVPVGRRVNRYFGKRDWTFPCALPELGDQVDAMKARALAQELVAMQLGGQVDRVDLLYTQFLSTMSRRVVSVPVLPVAAGRTDGRPAREYIYEPSAEAIFHTLLPRYVENRILQAMAESLASEHSARMVSMGAATNNARDVITNLTMVGNKIRQAAITREISEIVGGADGLKQS